MQIKYIKIMYCCHFTDVKVIVHHTDDPACVVCRQQATTCPYVSNVILFVSNELWRAVNLLRCIMSTDHVCVCSLQLIIESSLIVIVSSSRPSAPRVNWGPKLNARGVGRITIRSVLMHARYRMIAPHKFSWF